MTSDCQLVAVIRNGGWRLAASLGAARRLLVASAGKKELATVQQARDKRWVVLAARRLLISPLGNRVVLGPI